MAVGAAEPTRAVAAVQCSDRSGGPGETWPAPLDDFDREGLLLSRELQRELGPAYSVQYSFTFAGSRDRLMPLVEDDPCPGWRVR